MRAFSAKLRWHPVHHSSPRSPLGKRTWVVDQGWDGSRQIFKTTHKNRSFLESGDFSSVSKKTTRHRISFASKLKQRNTTETVAGCLPGASGGAGSAWWGPRRPGPHSTCPWWGTACGGSPAGTGGRGTWGRLVRASTSPLPQAR